MRSVTHNDERLLKAMRAVMQRAMLECAEHIRQSPRHDESVAALHQASRDLATLVAKEGVAAANDSFAWMDIIVSVNMDSDRKLAALYKAMGVATQEQALHWAHLIGGHKPS